MYAAPSKAPAATRKTHDANYPQTAKVPAKLVQYRRGKGVAAAATGHTTSGYPQTTLTADDKLAADLDPRTAPLAAAGSSQQGVWSAQRLFGLARDAEGANAGAAVEMESEPGEHPLRFAWSFWFMHRAPGHKINDYEAAMTKIVSFASVESFWAAYSHLKRADEVPTITDYHLFRAGVRPVWEDPENINGGKWMIRLRKGLATRMWERLAVASVGNTFGVGDEVCGIVLSIRNSEDIISLWNKTALDTKATLHIRDAMKLIMGLPAECILEYKAHNDSLRDNSSFRQADIYK